MTIRSRSLLQKTVIPLVCLAISVSLLTFNIVQPRINLLGIAVSYLFYPFQKAVHEVNLLTNWLKEYCQLSKTLKEENKAQKMQIRQLSSEIAGLKETEAALYRLQFLLNFEEENKSLEVIAASVIGMNPSNWVNVVIIDKGTLNGVRENMPVVTQVGVIGQVVKASPHFAKVLLIIDQRSGVGAMVQRTRAVGVLEGQLSQTAMLKYLDPMAEVALNDIVVSSGLGGVFPKGLVLGRITNIQREKTGVYQQVEVKLAVNFSLLEEVLVIKKVLPEEGQALLSEEEEK